MMINENQLNAVGQRIKDVRIALGYTQKDFASEIGFSNSVLCSIEKGNVKDLGISIVMQLFHKFNVNAYYLLFGSGDMFIDGDLFQLIDNADYNVKIEDIKEFFHHFVYSKSLQLNIMSYYHMQMSEHGNAILNQVEETRKNIKKS